MTLGERIKERRQILDLTQHDLAKALGLTAQHVSAIEQDKRAPSLPCLVRLAEELGVSGDYLLTGREGIVMETIPAIKADKRLSLKAKKALISLVEEVYKAA